MKLPTFGLLALVATVNAIAIQTEEDVESASLEPSSSLVCPDYQYKCPDCPDGQQCVYPDSGGCPGAGIPICQSTDCHGIRCLTKRIPCPDECPFRCKYSGPVCCPFLGEPVCEPQCQTFAPCQVTPCPEECPGDCSYPDADYCCPKSGQPVCNSMKEETTQVAGDGYKSGGAPEAHEWYNGYVYDDSWGYQSFGYDEREQGWNNDPQPELAGRHLHHHEGRHEGHHDYEYYHGDEKHYHDGDNHDGCPVCTKTVTDVSVALEFVTSTRPSGATIDCVNHIVPCPPECPYDCIYPMHQRCPFTQQPWCPSILDDPYGDNYGYGNGDEDEDEDCDTIYNTMGYQYPYFPSYDPYHDLFTSILNHSGVTSTPTFLTEEPTETPAIFCPLIFVFCPTECPDTCLRQNVPCPFAAEGYCPGDEPPSTTIDGDEITTPAETVLEDGGVLCPLYILACPFCPEGYSCTRETTGYCPNTNVPYCYSTASPESTATSTVNKPIFEFYPDPYPPQPTHQWDGWESYEDEASYHYHAMSFGGPASVSHYSAVSVQKEAPEDVCVKAGFTRIPSKQVFEQIQERRSDCQDCPILEWDEQCDNVCVFRTENNCCIQSVCFPNQ